MRLSAFTSANVLTVNVDEGIRKKHQVILLSLNLHPSDYGFDDDDGLKILDWTSFAPGFGFGDDEWKDPRPEFLNAIQQGKL